MPSLILYLLGCLALLMVIQSVKWGVDAFMANDAPLAFVYVLVAVALAWLGAKLLGQSRKKDQP